MAISDTKFIVPAQIETLVKCLLNKQDDVFARSQYRTRLQEYSDYILKQIAIYDKELEKATISTSQYKKVKEKV